MRCPLHDVQSTHLLFRLSFWFNSARLFEHGSQPVCRHSGGRVGADALFLVRFGEDDLGRWKQDIEALLLGGGLADYVLKESTDMEKTEEFKDMVLGILMRTTRSFSERMVRRLGF
jgi:hypothetical protein